MSTPTPQKTTPAQEQALIARIRRGDRAATRELVDQHKERLFAFLRRMVHNHHDAEEICQETFLKAFASLDSYSTEFRFSTWLFTIGYRVCLNSLRRKHAITGDMDFSGMPAGGRPGTAELIESEEAAKLKDAVWTAVEELSPPQRATVLLFYRHDQSCHEISRVLELPLATVKSHLHRARNRLRTLLEPVAQSKEIAKLRNQAG